jgi:hypothetical protein
MTSSLPARTDGRLAVHRMSQEGHRPELVQVQAALNSCRRTGSDEVCGSWVISELPADAQPRFSRRNLQTLARYGVLVPTGDVVRGGHRRYYRLPDAVGVSRALRELGWPG